MNLSLLKVGMEVQNPNTKIYGKVTNVDQFYIQIKWENEPEYAINMYNIQYSPDWICKSLEFDDDIKNLLD